MNGLSDLPVSREAAFRLNRAGLLVAEWLLLELGEHRVEEGLTFSVAIQFGLDRFQLFGDGECDLLESGEVHSSGLTVDIVGSHTDGFLCSTCHITNSVKRVDECGRERLEYRHGISLAWM